MNQSSFLSGLMEEKKETEKQSFLEKKVATQIKDLSTQQNKNFASEQKNEEIEEQNKKIEEGKELEKKDEKNKEIKEEKPVEKQKEETKKVKKKSFPWILGLLFVVLIVFGGLAMQKVLENQEVKKGEWGSDLNKTKSAVEIKNFYSSECSFCEKENSIIANFKSPQRNIDIKIESIDLSKEENKHFIEEFNLDVVPTALVNAKDLEEHPFVENLIKESFNEKKGYYIIPESYLDGQAHNIMLLDEVQECNSSEGKVLVEEFFDYQCFGCASIFEATKNARKKFAGEIIFKYKNYPVNGEKSESAAIAAECAREQGRFFGFNKYLYEKSFPQVFGIEKDPVDNSSDRVIIAGTFVTQIPDVNEFNSCISEKNPLQKIKDEAQLAVDYKVKYAPSLVFDCKYVVQGRENTGKIEEIICELHPELNSCKELEEEGS